MLIYDILFYIVFKIENNNSVKMGKEEVYNFIEKRTYNKLDKEGKQKKIRSKEIIKN